MRNIGIDIVTILTIDHEVSHKLVDFEILEDQEFRELQAMEAESIIV